MPSAPAVPSLLSFMMASREEWSLPPINPSSVSARPSIWMARVIMTEIMISRNVAMGWGRAIRANILSALTRRNPIRKPTNGK